MRKRKHYNMYESLTEFISLHQAFKNASRGKRNRMSVISLAVRLEESLLDIQRKLRDGTYEFGPYRSFHVYIPKKRLIESACFRDRIVHHAICAKLEPVFLPQFYRYSFACLPGRGTHKGMLALAHWMRTSRRPYYLKCDVSKYFPSIDRHVLLSLLSRSIGDVKMMALLERLIFSAPRTGIPIGNLTSQLFANVYLHELDNYVKRQLGQPYYIRYMDDFVFLLPSRLEAVELRAKVEDFVESKLKMQLSPQKVRVGHVNEGLPFVGYCLRPNRIRVRGASLRRSRRLVIQSYKKSFPAKSFRIRENWDAALVRQSPFFRSWSSFVGQTNYADDAFYLQRRLLADIERSSRDKVDKREKGNLHLQTAVGP